MILSLPAKKNACAGLKTAVQCIVDRYVMVDELQVEVNESTETANEGPIDINSNPHVARIAAEHNYASVQITQQPKRRLPHTISRNTDPHIASLEVKKRAPDGVFNCGSAVLNDGLLLLELRDAIREGDGPRVIRCWKFLLLYWRQANHTKYSLEALHLTAAINATATQRLSEELTWCRFVNIRGKARANIPVDLFMEHLNRTLKDYLLGLGQNRLLSKQASLFKISCTLCDLHPESIYHTCQKYGKDLQLVVDELVSKSNIYQAVFTGVSNISILISVPILMFTK